MVLNSSMERLKWWKESERGRLKEHEDEHSCTLAFGIDIGDEGTTLILVASGINTSGTKPQEILNNCNLSFAVTAIGDAFLPLVVEALALMRSKLKSSVRNESVTQYPR